MLKLRNICFNKWFHHSACRPECTNGTQYNSYFSSLNYNITWTILLVRSCNFKTPIKKKIKKCTLFVFPRWRINVKRLKFLANLLRWYYLYRWSTKFNKALNFYPKFFVWIKHVIYFLSYANCQYYSFLWMTPKFYFVQRKFFD